jgi:hypothetical protein
MLSRVLLSIIAFATIVSFIPVQRNVGSMPTQVIIERSRLGDSLSTCFSKEDKKCKSISSSVKKLYHDTRRNQIADSAKVR